MVPIAVSSHGVAGFAHCRLSHQLRLRFTRLLHVRLRYGLHADFKEHQPFRLPIMLSFYLPAEWQISRVGLPPTGIGNVLRGASTGHDIFIRTINRDWIIL